MRAFILAAIAAAIAACAPPAGDARSIIEERTAAFVEAFNAHDAAAVAALYTEDAMILPPGAPAATGRDAIAAYWQAGIDGGAASAVLTTDEATQLDKSNIVEVGRYEIRDAAGAAVETGKYIVHWRQTPDGWRLYRDIWNVTP